MAWHKNALLYVIDVEPVQGNATVLLGCVRRLNSLDHAVARNMPRDTSLTYSRCRYGTIVIYPCAQFQSIAPHKRAALYVIDVKALQQRCCRNDSLPLASLMGETPAQEWRRYTSSTYAPGGQYAGYVVDARRCFSPVAQLASAPSAAAVRVLRRGVRAALGRRTLPKLAGVS